MNAIITKGAKYDCNVYTESDHIWLPSFPIGTKYDYNDRKFARALDLFKNHTHVTLGRIPILQSYSVPIGKDCNHMWSDSELGLHLYWATFLANIAIIFFPVRYEDCNNIWSLASKLLQ